MYLCCLLPLRDILPTVMARCSLFVLKVLLNSKQTNEHLIESLDATCYHRWEETTEQMNFTKLSRKSWSLIQHLGAAENPPRTSHPLVKADAITNHLLQVARAPVNKKHKRRVQVEWWYLL